jgi:small Trp-rich protein
MAMWFLGIGVVLLLMKFLEFGPVATWSWWIVLLPFGLALLWFEVIEPFFGLDKKKAHNDLEKVKQERIRKGLERMTHRR